LALRGLNFNMRARIYRSVPPGH